MGNYWLEKQREEWEEWQKTRDRLDSDFVDFEFVDLRCVINNSHRWKNYERLRNESERELSEKQAEQINTYMKEKPNI